MNREKMIEDLSTLVAFKTTNGNKKPIQECFEYIASELNDLPFELERYENEGVVTFLWKSPNSSKKILLNAHLDVVPASDYKVTMTKDKIHGRGVSDMKFAIATFIEVVREYFQEFGYLPPADILISSDEEVGGMRGVGFFVETQNPQYELVIIPDGGNDWHIVEEAKGVLQVKLTVKGASAHASRPWEGENAVIPLLHDLQALLQEFPELRKQKWVTTMNIGQVHGGSQTNQVPNHAEALLDIRHIVKDKKKEIKAKLKRICKYCQIEYPIEADVFWTDINNPLIQIWRALISEFNANPIIKEDGASDGRYFSAKGIPVLLSKPIGGGIHTENEWLDTKSWFAYTQNLLRYIKHIEKQWNK